MPNQFFYRPLTSEEFRDLRHQAGLSDGELQRLTGRTRLDLVALLAGDLQPRPVEAVLLAYLAAHPERKADMIAAAGSMIVGHKKDEGRAARRAHLQPKT